MEKSLRRIAIWAARDALFAVAEKSTSITVGKITTLASTALAHSILRASSTFTLQFVLLIFKKLVHSEDTDLFIRTQLSKLVAEPFKTGVDQLKLADSIQPTNIAEQEHRIERYKNALVNLDRAFSVAKPEEQLFILLLRGVTALQIPGGQPEAKIHLAEFHKRCSIIATEIEKQAIEKENKSIEKHVEANQRKLTRENGSGGRLMFVGSGSFLGMALGEDDIIRATIEYESVSLHSEAQKLQFQAEEIRDAAKAVEVLAELSGLSMES